MLFDGLHSGNLFECNLSLIYASQMTYCRAEFEATLMIIRG